MNLFYFFAPIIILLTILFILLIKYYTNDNPRRQVNFDELKLHRTTISENRQEEKISPKIEYTEKEKLIQKNHLLKENSDYLQAQVEILQEENETLKLNDLLRTKMFALVSHDLRSPLASLGGLIDLFEKKDLSREEFANLFPQLKKMVANADEMVNSLLQWSEYLLEKKEIHISKINTEALLRLKVNKFKPIAKNKNIDILFSSDLKHLTFIVVDKNMVLAVFRNLITNAIKFTNPGGKIILSAKIYHKNNDFILFSVFDTGVGIKIDKLDKIFRNHIGSTNGTEGEKGTGLGLIFCKEFINQSGGEIWVESELNTGSTFYFTLPKMKE